MTIRPFLLAIAGLLSVAAQAAPPPAATKTAPPADLPAAIQRQLESREAIQKRVEEGQAALRTWYQNALDAVKKDALAKGDLDGVVATDAERDRTERELTDHEKQALPKASRGVRDQYDEARAKQANQAKAAITSSLLAYAATLADLEKGSHSKKLDDAIATRLERAKVSGLVAGGGEVPAPRPAVPEPANPVPAPAPKPAAPTTVATISRENPAKIECEDIVPTAIGEGGNSIEVWTSFPPDFKDALIYLPKTVKADQSKAAVIYKTLEPGRVYAVVNFQDQGNSGGGWKNDRWIETDFLAHGWSRVAGAEFVNQKGGTYMVLTKVLTKEDGGRLRSNKYNPPYLVTFAHAGS